MTGPRPNLPVPAPRFLRRGFDDFAELLSAATHPVVLLEGSRNAPPAVQSRMEALAAHLLRAFPDMIARSGNAEGSDQAWSRGVNSVDPSRLQLVLPVPGYRRDSHHAANDVLALQDAPAAERFAARELTREHYVSGHRTGAAAFDRLADYRKHYLDRDALKVLGPSDYRGRRQQATAALFHLDPAKKDGGGTGHTARLCEALGVPWFLSDDWLDWPAGV